MKEEYTTDDYKGNAYVNNNDIFRHKTMRINKTDAVREIYVDSSLPTGRATHADRLTNQRAKDASRRPLVRLAIPAFDIAGTINRHLNCNKGLAYANGFPCFYRALFTTKQVRGCARFKYAGPPSWRLGVGLTQCPCKNLTVQEPRQRKSQAPPTERSAIKEEEESKKGGGEREQKLHEADAFFGSQQVLSYSRNSTHFIEPEGSSPYSQEPAICTYPEPE
jgi:hypothetical protein